MSDKVIDRLCGLLDDALAYDSNTEEPPLALFWPDKDRQWESAVSRIQESRTVLRLGDLAPELMQGPAYWLRCVIAGKISVAGPFDGPPIIYLPGYSRHDLRLSNDLGRSVAPLAALQTRSHWFSHKNGKDWTVRSLFGNGGLKLSVANDEATATALVASIGAVLEKPMVRLQAKHLDADFLNDLLSPDPTRSLLRWIDEPDAVRAEMSKNEWSAAKHQWKSEFGFDPDKESEIDAARLLGEGDGEWRNVWTRFREAPREYENIPEQLRLAQPAELVPTNPGSWPTIAGHSEEKIREVFLSLEHEAPEYSRTRVLKLEEEHKERRGYLWADLGHTPLVLALEHVAEAARLTANGAPSGSVDEIKKWYSEKGWQADKASLLALNEVDPKADTDAVSAVLKSIYVPWLKVGAVALQTAVGPAVNSGSYQAESAVSPQEGEVVVFVDGLRFDVAQLLSVRLAGSNLSVEIESGLAALPTVTSTSKPALVPIDQTLLCAGDDLFARRSPDGPSASVDVLRALMKEAAVQVLRDEETGDSTGVAWTEVGKIDHLGHDVGLLLAHEITTEVEQIAQRIQDLFDAGWETIKVVTDHGWLLVPGGMPKNEGLPVAVTEVKKGRCARIKAGSIVGVPTVPWHWDPNVSIAIAPGVSCFEANNVYEHGGVSPQEAIVPRLTVTRGDSFDVASFEITNTKWSGLVLAVKFANLPEGATVDLRMNAADGSSSIADLAAVTGGTGKVFLMVEDEELEGSTAQLVVVSAAGSTVFQRAMSVGQNR